jgi:biotin transport system substrate-specific component
MHVSPIRLRLSSWANIEAIRSPALSKIAGIFIFLILTTLGAFVYIPLPFTPVPVTLQTFFVILSGAMLGPLDGGISQLAYLILGGAGLPIFFGGHSGIAHLFGPTGGYIWGFLFSSYITGKLIHRKKRDFLSVGSSFLLGIFVIYLFGMLQLSLFVNKNLFSAFRLGVVPFILPDAVKVFLATAFYCRSK